MKGVSQLHLENDIERAFALYLDSEILGPEWSELAEAFAKATEEGGLSMELAGKINYLLRRTRGDPSDTCAVCSCPEVLSTHHWGSH